MTMTNSHVLYWIELGHCSRSVGVTVNITLTNRGQSSWPGDWENGVCGQSKSPQVSSLSQWLNFQLSGITCLVGKLKFKLLSQGPLAEWVSISECSRWMLRLKVPVKTLTLGHDMTSHIIGYGDRQPTEVLSLCGCQFFLYIHMTSGPDHGISTETLNEELTWQGAMIPAILRPARNNASTCTWCRYGHWRFAVGKSPLLAKIWE